MVEFGEIEYMVEIMTLNVLKTEPFFYCQRVPHASIKVWFNGKHGLSFDMC